MGRESGTSQKGKAFQPGKLYWVKGSALNEIWEAIRANRVLAGKNTKTRQTHDGIVLDASGGTAAVDHVFNVKAMGDGSGGFEFTVTPGTYDGIYPTLGGVTLDDIEPPVGVLGTGVQHVYIKAIHDLEDEDGFVYSAFVDTAEIVVLSDVVEEPVGPNGSGEFYVLLASFDEGVKTAQPVRHSIYTEVADVGGGEGLASWYLSGWGP